MYSRCINFHKGQKVWCTARVSWLGYSSVMCGIIKWKVPKFMKWLVCWHIIHDVLGDFYYVKMQNGKSIFYSQTKIYDINDAIKEAESWGVNEECKEPSQMDAHLKLVSWYENMKFFAKLTARH